MRKVLQWICVLAACVWPSVSHAYQSSDDVIQREFSANNAATLFRAGNFESLDATLSTYAEFRQTTHGGDWYLSSLHEGLARLVDEAIDADELDEIDAQANVWIKTFPKSAGAYLGYATILIQRGLREAGGPRIAKESIARVRALLSEHRDIVASNAHYHAILVRLAIAENATLDTMLPLVGAAAEANPSYSAPWLLAAEHVLTESANGAGDLETLARFVLDKTRAVEGSAQYTRIYQHAFEIAYGTNLFQASKVSWFDLKAGITALSQRYPRSGLNTNEFAVMACAAGDQAALTPLMKNIESLGREPPRDIWGDMAFFEACRSWASGSTAAKPPLRPSMPIAIQYGARRLAFDPSKRLTAAYETSLRARLTSEFVDVLYEPGFRSLESLAAKYRSKKMRTPSGISMLWAFYLGIQNVYGRGIEENYERVEKQLNDYRTAFPNSPTPIVLKAHLMLARAALLHDRVDADGNPDAFAVKLSDDIVEDARLLLETNEDIGRDDPQWYELMIGIGKVQKWTMAEVDAVVAEGVRRHPWYHHLVYAGVFAHIHGDSLNAFKYPGLENYARKVQLLMPAEERQLIYSRLYWAAEQGWFSYGLFQYSSASWQDMRSGFEQIVTAYPSGWNENAFAYFACLAGDAPKLRELLKRIESHNEEPPWQIWQSPDLRNACLRFAQPLQGGVIAPEDDRPAEDPT